MYKQSILSAACAQAYGYLVTTSDEHTGARWFAALFKAKDEILANGTIRFDRGNRVLRFVSRNSGKRRIVTEFGCADSCDCKGGISYHRGIFEILDRYYLLLGDDPAEQIYSPQRLSNQTRETCGRIKF